ncbi:DUF6268 family outer membrane beta-barrel protein [Aeoliella mucimassa]|uniref:DUF6268 domain-containing protein n=1 Tax=Aeoliella mucimassa TaxID=2527972 RepID=A0A518ALI6_9BACT|nr:DUF6268 family outer membrane beta-barrel protein [Aeoliella mucimassa]QDU55566.1 hypothetical protein Pan181_17580 [Aeoliella mucimassa]
MSRRFLLVAIGCLMSASAGGQTPTTVAPVYVEPLQDPATWTTAEPDDMVLYGTDTMQGSYPICPPTSPAAEKMGNLIPPGARQGFFQKANASVTWMPRLEGDSLGVTAIQTNIVTAVPFPHRYTPLTITPEYTLRLLDGPDFIDVPSRLHDLSVGFNHIRPLNDKWVFNGRVSLGLYGDDYSLDASDAFRASGYAMGIHQKTPNSPHKWIVGVAYFNRAGMSVFPVAGYMYKTEDLQVDVTFPRPKIAWRTWAEGCAGYNERWWYISGDFGGGIWAVQRDSGADDTLSYSDIRVLVGTERIRIGHLSTRLEFGYVFARELEYDSMSSELAVDDSIFVRGALRY